MAIVPMAFVQITFFLITFLDGQADGWTDKCMKGQIDKVIYEWTDRSMD